jgi:hypothetical protein
LACRGASRFDFFSVFFIQAPLHSSYRARHARDLSESGSPQDDLD